MDKVHILTEWLLRGQEDWTGEKIASVADSEERIDVELQRRAQLRIAYLTAWAQPDGAVHFRPDSYNLDGTGFVSGQPVPEGERALAYVPDGSLLDAETGLQIDQNAVQKQAKQRELAQSKQRDLDAKRERRRQRLEER